MTVKERISDISQNTGISEDVVRRVLDAECESVAKSLIAGERATLIGRCTFIPYIYQKYAAGDTADNPKMVRGVAVKVAPSKSMLARLDDIDIEALAEPDDVKYDIPRLETIQIEGLV